MRMTNHCEQRMNQRGHTKPMIDLAIQLGEVKGDKYVANKKVIKNYLYDLDRKIKRLFALQKKLRHLKVVCLIHKAISALLEIRRIALKVLDKGGVTVVCHDDALITTYNTNSFIRN